MTRTLRDYPASEKTHSPSRREIKAGKIQPLAVSDGIANGRTRTRQAARNNDMGGGVKGGGLGMASPDSPVTRNEPGDWEVASLTK